MPNSTLTLLGARTVRSKPATAPEPCPDVEAKADDRHPDAQSDEPPKPHPESRRPAVTATRRGHATGPDQTCQCIGRLTDRRASVAADSAAASRHVVPRNLTWWA